MKRFYIPASGAIQGNHGPLVIFYQAPHNRALTCACNALFILQRNAIVTNMVQLEGTELATSVLVSCHGVLVGLDIWGFFVKCVPEGITEPLLHCLAMTAHVTVIHPQVPVILVSRYIENTYRVLPYIKNI